MPAAVSPAPIPFAELADRRDREVDSLLDASWWQPWRRPWDSEHRKSLARIKTSLQAARRLHDCGMLKDEAELVRLLDRPLRRRRLDTVIELVYALDEALVATGDVDLLRRRVCAELMPDGDEATFAEVSAALDRQARFSSAAEVEDARQKLLELYEMRRYRYRRLRARRRMRSGALIVVGAILAALVVALALTIEDAIGADADLVGLSALAGALGGTLANLFRVRDKLRRGTELRAFKPMFLAQPVVGAAAGLVVLLVVESGFFGATQPGTTTRWSTVALLAFAAGMSEAFFLGLLRKAAGADSDDEFGSCGPRARSCEDTTGEAAR